MAPNHILVVVLLATVLLPTVTAAICYDSQNMGTTGECTGCIVFADGTQACTRDTDYYMWLQCFDDGSGKKYYACVDDLCNTCCDDKCGPMPNNAPSPPGPGPGPAPGPAPAPAPGKKSGSAYSQPLLVVLGIVGVVHALY
uniref:Snake toxin/toxin-like domain-containing protein n=1 Tax=Panagrellus redivivus TaxID=6233 RepID=A0A7E4VKW7_PANRE